MSDSTPKKTCCADCGFLSYPNKAAHSLEEVDCEERQHGKLHAENIGSTSYFGFIPSPVCFVMAFDLPDEIQQTYNQATSEQEKNESTKKVIDRPRECKSFCRWQQGFSPKEHKEMMDSANIMKWQEDEHLRRMKEEERRRKEDLEWRATQEEKTEARWNKEHRLQRHQLLVVGIVGTIILAIAQIVGSLIQAGWFK
jgi:hypothetical protein